MSQLSLPPSGPERQDARRYDKPPHRGKRQLKDVNRARHLYLSIVPAVLVACLGLIAVMTLVGTGPWSPRVQLTLAVIAVGAIAVVCAAALAAEKATRRERRAHLAANHPVLERDDATQRQLGELSFLVSRGRQDMQGLTERIALGDAPPTRDVDSRPAATDDPIAYLAHELQKAQNEAWNAVVNAAGSKHGAGSAQRPEVFVNLARRMQSLSHRAIQGLDELENRVEDPELLKGLFRVDHLVTRLRRQAESLAVVGGATSRRQWSRPVSVHEVLRSAVAEVEQYNRVKVVPPVEGTLEGRAVADVVHLLAELIENATRFAPPHTQVLLRVEQVTAGLAIEIEDRGLGIPRETQRLLNDLLADLTRFDPDALVQDGRIGLLVVASLSSRHRILVRLQTNIYAGTQAVIVIPNELLGSASQVDGAPPAVARESRESVPPTSADTSIAAPQSTPVSTFARNIDQSPAPSGAVGERTGSAAPADGGQRPKLPTRPVQANLVPELRNAPAPRGDDTEAEHDHGMMAAFQKGMRSGQEEDDPTHGTDGTG